MINLAKTFDEAFKKDVNSLIRKGLIDMKKAMPKGSVYSSSKKPPKDAQVFRTARGTEYWVPVKKDKEDSKEVQTTDLFSNILTTSGYKDWGEMSELNQERGKEALLYASDKLKQDNYSDDEIKYARTQIVNTIVRNDKRGTICVSMTNPRTKEGRKFYNSVKEAAQSYRDSKEGKAKLEDARPKEGSTDIIPQGKNKWFDNHVSKVFADHTHKDNKKVQEALTQFRKISKDEWERSLDILSDEHEKSDDAIDNFKNDIEEAVSDLRERDREISEKEKEIRDELLKKEERERGTIANEILNELDNI